MYTLILLFSFREKTFPSTLLLTASHCIMTQPGAGARAKRFKCNSFSRTVTLIKTNDEHTSFSDMRNLKTKSVIEFSSSMTQDNVRDKIQETFPYLENKR